MYKEKYLKYKNKYLEQISKNRLYGGADGKEIPRIQTLRDNVITAYNELNSHMDFCNKQVEKHLNIDAYPTDKVV